MTSLYSINLRILGVPNVALLEQATIFSGCNVPVLVVGAIVILVFIALAYILKTEVGLAIRAAGANAKMCAAYGVLVSRAKILSLSISNAIVALAGAVFAQMQGFSDISMGTGTIVIGLASVIIGEALLKKYGLIMTLFSCVIGSIIYRVIIAFALNSSFIGLKATDLNIITAVMVAIIMIVTRKKRV